MDAHSNSIVAIESQLCWLRWSQTPEANISWQVRGYSDAFEYCTDILERAVPFYMNSNFCRLVDHARRDIPNELKFETSWLQAPNGFLWLEKSFEVPRLKEYNSDLKIYVPAIGWRDISGMPTVYKDQKISAPSGWIQFCCFVNVPSDYNKFGCWSYFILRNGEILNDRVVQYESSQETHDPECAYEQKDSRVIHPLHEIRWVYTALYLMAQRLTTIVHHKVNRAVRRRAEKHNQISPPFLRVITLRRMEEARKKEGATKDVDWQWQWEVRGHWRNQFYASEGIYKPKFIEAYIKGPPNKPFKSTTKLFVASR